MGDFHAEVVELQRAQALLKLAERKLSDWSPIITRAYHRLDSQQNGTITNVRGAIVGWGRIYDAQWERIKKMISFIDTAMAEMEQAEEQAYKELADAVNLSEDRFNHLFKESMGVAPQQYINEIRLKKAMNLLKKKNGNVAEIAYSVGYTDYNHFGRQFRKMFGCPPSKILNQ